MKPVLPKKPPVSLFRQYKQITDGTQYWRDNYLLEQWAGSKRPVVYYAQDLNGYRLSKRLGDWCWLARDTSNNEFLTIKFLGQSGNGQVKRELDINRFLRERCQSRHVCTIKDSFSIQHHMAKSHPKYRDVSFDVIAYPPTGTDLQMIHTPLARGNSPLPLSLKRQVQCIKEVVRGVAELHSLGIVHADIHPGNVALPPPSDEDIKALLDEPPVEHKVERLDGAPTPNCLPRSVVKPQDLGFGEGPCKIMDFGFSFQHSEGAIYKAEDFSKGATKAIEFETSETTAQPFKVDSWYIGQLIYYILTNGGNLMDPRPSNLPSHFRDCMTELEKGTDDFLANSPMDVQQHFRPIIRQLMDEDPAERLSVEDLVARTESF